MSQVKGNIAETARATVDLLASYPKGRRYLLSRALTADQREAIVDSIPEAHNRKLRPGECPHCAVLALLSPDA